MIIVTGGAGFIGSNIVKKLNERGIDDILVVDDLTDGRKCRNNELVYDIVLKLDNASPDYKFPVNMRRFKGNKVKIISNPMMNICFDKAEIGRASCRERVLRLV